MSAYTLRAPETADFEALYRIHRAAMGAHVEATWGPWDEAAQRILFDARIERGLLKVSEVDGAVAGLLELDDRFAPFDVENIALDPAYQGRGVGTAVLQSVQAQATELGIDVHLQVLRVNPAQRFYRRLGFVERGGTETHWLMRWSPAVL